MEREKNRTEPNRRAGEAGFRRIIEQNADAVIVVSREGVIDYANPAAEALLGRPAGELRGELFGIPVIPGERTEVDILRTGERARVAEMRVVEVDWEGDKAYLASLRDMTDRKQSEAAATFLASAGRVLADSLDYPTTLASVARLTVAYLADWCLIDMLEDRDTVQRVAVAHADPAQEEQARRLMGRFTLSDQGADGLPAVLRHGRTEAYPAMSESVLASLAGRPEDLGRLRELECKAALIVPLRARNRTLGAMTLLATSSDRRYDVGDQALAEEWALRAALAVDNARLYDEAQEAVRRRDEFLAMLAHELRNPLAPIVNAAHLMRLRGSGDSTVEKAREVIDRQSRHMVRLIDDLLDLSRITRGKIEIRKESVNLAEVVADAVQTSSHLMESRRHQLELVLPPEPVRLEADPTRLAQVITNLLNNASRYTEAGGRIWLTAQTEGPELVLRVRDTGIGIAPEMLARVFEPFAQADNSLARSQGGLGIGLTLVRGLVEMHGGRVQAFSEGLGKGTEVVVRLPLGVPQAAAGTPDQPIQASGSRVLIVEDNPDAREMLRDLLQILGHAVDTAFDGLEGVAKIRREAPEVALVDIGLPGLDGYQVAQEVRAMPGGEQIYLIALTGYSQPQDRRRALAAGFDAHLVKPVNLDQLEQMLARRREAPVPK